jgi:hypothetical protein
MSGRDRADRRRLTPPSETRGAVAIAAHLAAHAKVQLQSVFMEDDLLHRASLPFAGTPR